MKQQKTMVVWDSVNNKSPVSNWTRRRFVILLIRYTISCYLLFYPPPTVYRFFSRRLYDDGLFMGYKEVKGVVRSQDQVLKVYEQDVFLSVFIFNVVPILRRQDTYVLFLTVVPRTSQPLKDCCHPLRVMSLIPPYLITGNESLSDI